MSARLLNSFTLLAVLIMCTRVCAQTLNPSETPEELKGVGITEHLDETIPLELAFKDESSKDVHLRDYFKPGRPVILVPGYYRSNW